MSGDGADGSTSWADAASRLRRLHLGQLIGFVVFGAAVMAVVVLYALVSLDSREEQARLYDGLYVLATASDDLRETEFDYFMAERAGRPAVTPKVAAGLGDGRAAFARVYDQQGVDFPTSDAMTRRGREAIALLDRMIAVAVRSASGAGGPEAAARAAAEARPLIDRLDAVTAAWLGAINTEARRGTDRAEQAQSRFVAAVGSAVALLALGSLGLWWALGRSRDRVVSALRITTDEQLALGRVATAVPVTETAEALCALAALELARRPGVRTAVIARLDPEGSLVPVAHAGAGVDRALAGPVVTAVRESGRAALVAPPPRDAPGGLARGAAPIVRAGALWGVAVVIWGGRDAGGPEALARLGRMADLVALGVESVESRARLVVQAATDPLTGLANHRAFQERLAEEVERARRHGRALSLALFDLDDFKRVNDGLGHQAGDRVLVEVGARLAALARSGEMVARVGGEEFAWIMPETDGGGGFVAAERARQAVRRGPVGPVTEMTVSAGVCDLTDAGSAVGLVRLADGALYWAKTHGRDLVCRYTPEVVREVSEEDRVGRLSQLRAFAALRTLARAVDARDPSTQRHSERVAHLCHRLALSLGWSPARAAALHDAALLHDVGKVGVPDSVLLKPGPLTAQQRAVMETHAPLGAQIVSEVLEEDQIAWVRSHHERIDGGGYPDGLRDTEIPMGARIMAVADTWDALTADRPYRRGVDPASAIAICREVAGTQLDPDVARALEEMHGSGALQGPLEDAVAEAEAGSSLPA